MRNKNSNDRKNTKTNDNRNIEIKPPKTVTKNQQAQINMPSANKSIRVNTDSLQPVNISRNRREPSVPVVSYKKNVERGINIDMKPKNVRYPSVPVVKHKDKRR